jgi:cyclic pyranopterin phosphate synthase
VNDRSNSASETPRRSALPVAHDASVGVSDSAARELRDRSGRRVDYLRVSVTERCNLRCTYCMPAEGLPAAPDTAALSFDDIVFVAQTACSLGVDRIRLTGGEPLLRRGLTELVRKLRAETDVRDIALTTNALLLPKHAQALRDAGLSRLNVSLDSLRADRFERIARSRLLDETLRGIDAAEEAGFGPIKINTVIVHGFNDDEVDLWMERIKERQWIVRFLELMPIGEGAALRRLGGFEDVSALRDRLIDSHGIEPTDAPHGNGPARYWRVPGGGMVGFITPMSQPYCDTCSRFRLTSDGRIRPCLAFDVDVDARPAIESRDSQALRRFFGHAAEIKPSGHQWHGGQTTSTGMSTLGG